MKFLLDNWILVLMALVSGGMLLWTTFGRGIAAGAVSTAEAVRLINREKAVLIDISEPADYTAAHVAGARNIPLATIETAKNLPTNKALPLVVVCANGSRSSRAVAILKKMGYANAQALAGGLKAWREANLPVDKAEKAA